MSKVDQIIGYKRYEMKLPKDRQVPKNRSKGGNVEQTDNSKKEKANLRTFGEERKKFLEKMSKNKRKNSNKKDREKSKETEKDNYKRDDKKLKEQKKQPITRDFRFKEPYSASINDNVPVENLKFKPPSGSNVDIDLQSETRIMIDQAVQTFSPLNIQLSELFDDNILNDTKDNTSLLQDTEYTYWERRWSNCSTISSATTVSSVPDTKYSVNYNELPSFNSLALTNQHRDIYVQSSDQHERGKKLLQQEMEYSNKVKSIIMGLETLCTDRKLPSDTGLTGRQLIRWSEFPTCCNQTPA